MTDLSKRYGKCPECGETREYQWTPDWPSEIGTYWFLGWTGPWRDRLPDVQLVRVRGVANGGIMAQMQGRIIYEQSCLGLWTPATLPEPPVDQLVDAQKIEECKDES